MAFSDARNERARAETGKNATNHGGGGGPSVGGLRGTAGQIQDRINKARARAAGNIAPGVPEGFVSGMKNATTRRTPNPTPTRPLTAHNLFEAITSLPMGPFGVVDLIGGAVGVPGLGPSYEGPEGVANSPGDYDPTNRFGTGLLARMNRAGRGLQYKGY